MVKRIDHLICQVADIHAAHEYLKSLGFPESWPIGPFWPHALTSGIAIGGVNLELMQPEEGAPERATIDMIVFEPYDTERNFHELQSAGFECHIFDKIEPDPELLALRGFDAAKAELPQRICRNILFDKATAIPMFFCEYVPFLRQRLGPQNPALGSPYGEVVALSLQTPDPELAWREWDLMGVPDAISLSIQKGPSRRITEIQVEAGPVPWSGFSKTFDFV
ncbi:MAG: hypothetical protein BGO01_09730 [Armatimonadetes bacterium 55-13]|nr:hypothetical protein [Armatimonadota bacterium]OJU62684.1 MAG: hypothetical protein BGO01_09730 [Armatimonadetes bacterium 55-13]